MPEFLLPRSKYLLDMSCTWIYVLVMFLSFNQIWDDAVARNAEALAGVAAELLAFLAVYSSTDAAGIPRRIHATILRVLRPAESALRRLIVISARDVSFESVPPRVRLEQAVHPKPRRPASRMSFRLFDPRKRFGAQRVNYTTFAPRISFISPDAPFSPLSLHLQTPYERQLSASASDRHVSARHLRLRLAALVSALGNMPHQARRLARLRFNRENKKPPRYFSPLRPGNPPGHRNRSGHEIDDILAECHKFALGVSSELNRDTS